MVNRWTLTEEVEKEYYQIIEAFINKLTSLTPEQVENMDNDEFTIDLSDTKLRPYTLLELLKKFGYDDAEFDDNGWELDYWINICNPNIFSNCNADRLCIHGTGMTF